MARLNLRESVVTTKKIRLTLMTIILRRSRTKKSCLMAIMMTTMAMPKMTSLLRPKMWMVAPFSHETTELSPTQHMAIRTRAWWFFNSCRMSTASWTAGIVKIATSLTCSRRVTSRMLRVLLKKNFKNVNWVHAQLTQICSDMMAISTIFRCSRTWVEAASTWRASRILL